MPTATSISASPACTVPPPSRSANAITSALPATALAQNAFDGRSCDSQAAYSATNSGCRPLTTAPCDAGTVFIAHAENTGYAMITPSDVIARLFSCARVGSGSRRHHSSRPAGTAAASARPAR